MKKILIAMAVMLPVSSFAASENTIHFQGEVTDQTCSVTVNDNAASPTVLLPTVASTALGVAAKTAGMTNFTIGVTGCTAPAADLEIGTVFIANNMTASGRIGNTGTAKNVSLQLVDPEDETTPLDLTGATSNAGLVLAKDATTATHDFAVEYYAEGVATSGTVLGSVQYAVSYQ
jgi:major type 1 subunit fimbrin (pilin)